jgi:hypothetical protein
MMNDGNIHSFLLLIMFAILALCLSACALWRKGYGLMMQHGSINCEELEAKWMMNDGNIRSFLRLIMFTISRIALVSMRALEERICCSAEKLHLENENIDR